MAQYEYQFLTEGSGSFINDTAAQAINNHGLCYFDPTGNGWLLADADAAATMPVVGLSMAAIPINRKGRFLLKGFIGDATWTWTPNGIIYASTTPGVLTQTAPAGAGDVVQAVGIARTATIIWFDPAGFGGLGGGDSNTLEGETAFVGTDATKSGFVNYFLVDGIADEVQINAAITYVGGLGGGSVMLERGVYTLANSVLMNQEEVKLIGQGWDTYINGATFGHAINITANRCIVRDLQVSTTSGGTNNFDGIIITGDYARIQNIYVSQSDRDGIRIASPGNNATIESCYLDTIDEIGINIQRPNNFVTDNDISNTGSYGIGVTNTSSDNNVINDNRLFTTGDDGINVLAGADDNVIKGNRIRSFTNEALDDNSETVKTPVAQFQFTEAINGTIETTSPVGVLVDAATEAAVAWGQLPMALQGAFRINIWGVATDAPIGAGGQMHIDLTFNAGASNAAYNTANKSWTLTSYDCEEADYVANDVIHWVIDDGDVGSELQNLVAGDSIEMTATYRAGADPDGATSVALRVMEIEYV